MTDEQKAAKRQRLEQRATELGVEFKPNWNNGTFAMQISAAEKRLGIEPGAPVPVQTEFDDMPAPQAESLDEGDQSPSEGDQSVLEEDQLPLEGDQSPAEAPDSPNEGDESPQLSEATEDGPAPDPADDPEEVTEDNGEADELEREAWLTYADEAGVAVQENWTNAQIEAAIEAHGVAQAEAEELAAQQPPPEARPQRRQHSPRG